MMQLTRIRVAGCKILMLGVLLAAFMLLAAKTAHASTTFTVTNTNDNGPGSLRQAILNANATTGADAINFAIPGTDVHTISPISQLPTITGPVTINGYSQQGASPNQKAVGSDAALKIELSGDSYPGGTGLVLGAPNSTVKGLVINRWNSMGIRIDGANATGIKITGNYIGTDASGTQSLGNGVGVRIYYGSNNTIGGTTAAARNVLSGNRHSGIGIGDGDVVKGNKVTGNYIGTDASGTKDLGNTYTGVYTEDAPNTTIGGTTAGERNVISGNDELGVAISANGNRVTGNFIGTDASGTKDLGNTLHGMRIQGRNNTVGGTTVGERNVISGNEGNGVLIYSANTTGNKIVGNFIGTDKNGTVRLGNAFEGVSIEDAPNNTVGGTTAGARNVISGNGYSGVRIGGADATGNRVSGNFIGTDKNGTVRLGNASDGVRLYEAPNNIVGGATAGERNVISSNKNNGVLIIFSGADGNKIAGNYIGTDVSGTKDRGNTFDGVSIDSASNNVIGGTTAGERNVISGNGSDGVGIQGLFVTGNKIVGNYLGVDKDGAPLGNSARGVFIYDAPNVTVGGKTAGARNVISGNTASGISIFNSTATGDKILSNSIFANGGLGIDLGDDGVTANDPGDSDTGPNYFQNFPVISSAKTGTSTTTINASLNTVPDATVLVQFFSNPSGTDEGKRFIGEVQVTTDQYGDASFRYSPDSKVDVGLNITATVTGPEGNTSEFSAPKKMVAR
jgi:hypothetical protein